MFFYSIKRALLMVPILLASRCFVLGHHMPRRSGRGADGVRQRRRPSAGTPPEALRSGPAVYKPKIPHVAQEVRDPGLRRGLRPRPQVKDKILERLPITLTINLLSLVRSTPHCHPIGIMSATHQYSILDRPRPFSCSWILYAATSGWPCCSSIFSAFNGASCPSRKGEHGHDRFLRRSSGSWTALNTWSCGLCVRHRRPRGFSRYMRNNMLEVMRQDYIRTARAKGLPESTVNLTSTLCERTDAGHHHPRTLCSRHHWRCRHHGDRLRIDGMGRLMYQAVFSRDYNVAMGILVPRSADHARKLPGRHRLRAGGPRVRLR